jgi:hypothetical protein
MGLDGHINRYKALGLGTRMSGSLNFEWLGFLKFALLAVAMPGLYLLAQSRAGALDAASATVPLFCVSVVAFFAYRWSRLRRDYSAGAFTELEFRANPVKTVIGRPLHALIWFGVTFALALLPLAWWASTNFRQA